MPPSPSTVIPAKAGISLSAEEEPEIPACAGMTAESLGGKSLFANIFRLIFTIALLALPFHASAQTSLTYSKVTIRILPAAPKPEAASEEKNKKDDAASKPTEILPTLARAPKEFIVEMRPLLFLTQKDFIAHQPFGDKEGMLIIIDPPQAMPLKATNLLGKVDVLLVGEDGIIHQIAPDISLRELEEPIDSGANLRAFIFLKAGTARTTDIQPGDRVSGAMFKAHPVLLEAPPQ